MVAICGSYLFICGKTNNMQLSKSSLSLEAIWLEINCSMPHPSINVTLINFLLLLYLTYVHLIVSVSLLNRMFAFMLHSEYTTSCFMAKGVIWHNFQSQASRTDVSLFCSDSHFCNRLNENMLFCFLFVSSINYSLRFRHFGRRFSFRTVYLSRESRVLPPTQQFFRTRIKIIFRGRCQPRKLKSAKIKLHVVETKPRKFGNAKISHYTVMADATYLTPPYPGLSAALLSNKSQRTRKCTNNNTISMLSMLCNLIIQIFS